MKIIFLIFGIVISSAHAEGKSGAPPSIPHLCDHEGRAMSECARQNSKAMQEYTKLLTDLVLKKLTQAEAKTFKEAQDSWRESTWKTCVDKYYTNYPEGTYATNICLFKGHLERAKKLHEVYWK